jgi:NADPH-dependent ferric siderophore reductase
VPLIVTSCRELAPRARRIWFRGNLTGSSTLPAAYLSLWFSEPTEGRGDRAGRSDKRTFTARWLDLPGGSITVDFVLHGSGPAASWAASAVPGDRIWAGETRGGYSVPPPGSHLVLVGDDTAMPAIGAIAEASHDSVHITAVIEVIDEMDERPVSDQRLVDPIWVHRGDDPERAGLPTLGLLEDLSVSQDAYWWIAGEREAIRAMRDVVIDRGAPRDRLSLNAHWRLRPTDPRRERPDVIA